MSSLKTQDQKAITLSFNRSNLMVNIYYDSNRNKQINHNTVYDLKLCGKVRFGITNVFFKCDFLIKFNISHLE